MTTKLIHGDEWPTEVGWWVQRIRAEHKGNVYACRLMFLAAISHKTLEEFIELVNDQIGNHGVVVPSEEHLAVLEGMDEEIRWFTIGEEASGLNLREKRLARALAFDAKS